MALGREVDLDGLPAWGSDRRSERGSRSAAQVDFALAGRASRRDRCGQSPRVAKCLQMAVGYNRKQVAARMRTLQEARHTGHALPGPKDSWQKRLATLRANAQIPPPPHPALSATAPLDGMYPLVFNATWNRLEVGWDIAVRAFARAMRMAGVDVRLYPPNVIMSPEVAAEVGPLAHAITHWEMFVQSSCFARADMLAGTIAHLLRNRGRHVLYTMFERSRFDPGIRGLAQKIDAIWVPCTSNRDALHAVGIENAVAFPVPYFDDDPLRSLLPPARSEEHTSELQSLRHLV